MSSAIRGSASTSTTGSGLRVFYFLLTAAAIYFLAVHAIPRLAVSQANYGDYYWNRRYWLFVHVAFGLLATLLGPLQFISAIRRSRPGLHRQLGRMYLCAVMLAGFASLYLAVTSAITVMYTVGLCAIASSWLITAYVAYAQARRRRFKAHREWMIRNYTITFFFIVFFAVFDMFTLAGIGSPEVVATLGVWACWIVPLTLVELKLRSSRVFARTA